MVKLFIFDLDGTLVNSLEDLADATNYALKKHGYATHELSKYRYFVGDGVLKLIERAILEDGNKSDKVMQLIEEFNFYYEKHFSDKTRPYDGITELIKELKEKGIKVAVASNKPDDFTKKIVKTFFGDNFDIVRGQIEGVPKKPDSSIAINIMHELNVSKEETVFVGDTNIDIRTARNAGTKSVGCLWGFRDYKELAEAGADNIAEKPADILTFYK